MDVARMGERVEMLVMMGMDVKDATAKAYDEEKSFEQFNSSKENTVKILKTLQVVTYPVSADNVIGLGSDGLSFPVSYIR